MITFTLGKGVLNQYFPLKKVVNHLFKDPLDKSAPFYSTWHKADLRAKAIMWLSVFDAHLNQAQQALTAKKMWTLMCILFEKSTLPSKLAAQRSFCTRKCRKTMLPFGASIRHLAATLKSMSVTADDSKLAIALLNGLPGLFHTLISALDAFHIDDKNFTFEFVQSRCHQEEQRHILRDRDSLTHTETAELFTKHSNKQNRAFQRRTVSTAASSGTAFAALRIILILLPMVTLLELVWNSPLQLPSAWLQCSHHLLKMTRIRVSFASYVYVPLPVSLHIQISLSFSMPYFGLLTQDVFLTSRTTGFYSPVTILFPPHHFWMLGLTQLRSSLVLVQSLSVFSKGEQPSNKFAAMCFRFRNFAINSCLFLQWQNPAYMLIPQQIMFLCFVNRIPYWRLLGNYLADCMFWTRAKAQVFRLWVVVMFRLPLLQEYGMSGSRIQGLPQSSQWLIVVSSKVSSF